MDHTGGRSSNPLLSHSPGDAVAYWRNRDVTCDQFLASVMMLAAQIPANEYAINLCNDRFSFMIAFGAAMVAGQTTLLPPSRVPSVICDIAERHEGSYCLVDETQSPLPLVQHEVRPAPFDAEIAGVALPAIPSDFVAAVAFTSGSTGIPRANPKLWGDLVIGAQLADRRFSVSPMRHGTIVATVPPQHMYGLEISIVLPMVAAVRVHGGLPFYPEDIRLALKHVPGPRILFTTPTHLRACVESELEWPAVNLIVSATAPLSASLAGRAEARLGAPVKEIYGCTETGSMASRRTVQGDLWLPYDGLTFEERDGVTRVSGGHVTNPIELNDLLELYEDGTFRLLGRHSDMVNVAGNRASLSDLNLKLNAIKGVQDGVFVARDDDGENSVTRLAALVVAPELETKQILALLAKEMNPVFLPRPLLKVERLPRNALGKLPREDLLKLLREIEKSRLHSSQSR